MRLFITLSFLYLFHFSAHASSAAIEIAITVDDLPSPSVETTEEMLAAFDRHDLQGVYGFINGGKAKSPDDAVLNLWVERGHFLANHTFSHMDFTNATLAEYVNDIKANEYILEYYSEFGTLFGWRYFRFPFLREGNTEEKRRGAREFLKKNGYRTAQVTVDFGDYLWNAPYTRCLKANDPDAIQWIKESYANAAVESFKGYAALARTIFGRDIKHILLFHVGALNAAASDLLLEKLKTAGAKFVSLEAAMSDPAYEEDPNVLSKGGANFLDQMARARRIPYPKNPPIPSPPKEKLSQLCR